MKHIKTFLSIISGFALLAFLYKLFTSKAPVKDDFPLADEKKAAEKEVLGLKEEITELEKKSYSDEEIEKRFNTRK